MLIFHVNDAYRSAGVDAHRSVEEVNIETLHIDWEGTTTFPRAHETTLKVSICLRCIETVLSAQKSLAVAKPRNPVKKVQRGVRCCIAVSSASIGLMGSRLHGLGEGGIARLSIL